MERQLELKLKIEQENNLLRIKEEKRVKEEELNKKIEKERIIELEKVKHFKIKEEKKNKLEKERAKKIEQERIEREQEETLERLEEERKQIMEENGDVVGKIEKDSKEDYLNTSTPNNEVSSYNLKQRMKEYNNTIEDSKLNGITFEEDSKSTHLLML